MLEQKESFQFNYLTSAESKKETEGIKAERKILS
jgi:hypothetical protein